MVIDLIISISFGLIGLLVTVLLIWHIGRVAYRLFANRFGLIPKDSWGELLSFQILSVRRDFNKKQSLLKKIQDSSDDLLIAQARDFYGEVFIWPQNFTSIKYTEEFQEHNLIAFDHLLGILERIGLHIEEVGLLEELLLSQLTIAHSLAEIKIVKHNRQGGLPGWAEAEFSKKISTMEEKMAEFRQDFFQGLSNVLEELESFNKSSTVTYH